MRRLSPKEKEALSEEELLRYYWARKNTLPTEASPEVIRATFGIGSIKSSDDDLAFEGGKEDKKKKKKDEVRYRRVCCCRLKRTNILASFFGGEDIIDEEVDKGIELGEMRAQRRSSRINLSMDANSSFNETEPTSSLTPEQRARAKANWAKLRMHIKSMRIKVNYLVRFLDEENENKIENMQVHEMERGSREDKPQDQQERKSKTCVQNLIIMPGESSWLGMWKFIWNLTMFWGYVYDPYYLAFEGSQAFKEFPPSILAFMIVDVIMVINMIISCFTSFQQDLQWSYSLPEVICNYLRGSFMIDALSTVPPLMYWQERYFWVKLLRMYHVRAVYGQISDIVRYILQKLGLTKANVAKISFIINLIIYLFSAIHILGCSWVYIGRESNCSWMKQVDENEVGSDVSEKEKACITQGSAVDITNNVDIYITSIYWVITTLTTVGYGDYKGYTSGEYMFQMVVEFLGIGVFSYLMGSINDLVGSEITLQDIIDERTEDVESWLRKLEKSRSKNFSKQLYDSVKEYTAKSYHFDYYLIQNSDFFNQLKPRVRHRLINSLFGNFITNFFYLFNDIDRSLTDFEGGCEFTSDFLSSIYSRLYLPDNEIIGYGETVEEMVMIQEGVVLLNFRLGELQSQSFEFFVLPTFSYFGDYQILYDLKSQIQYKSGESKLLITLCLRKEKLLELMDEYPEARKFYMERAWFRRIEFRRRQKKFLLDLYHTEGILFKEGIDTLSEDGSSEECDDFEDSTMRANKKDMQRALEVRKAIRKNISRFFHNINIENELQMDFDSDALAEVSEDEKPDDLNGLLYDDHNQKGQEHAQEIQTRIEGMADLYDQMSEGLEQNLDKLSSYVATLQAQTAMGKEVDDVDLPKVRKLATIVEQ